MAVCRIPIVERTCQIHPVGLPECIDFDDEGVLGIDTGAEIQTGYRCADAQGISRQEIDHNRGRSKCLSKVVLFQVAITRVVQMEKKVM